IFFFFQKRGGIGVLVRDGVPAVCSPDRRSPPRLVLMTMVTPGSFAGRPARGQIGGNLLSREQVAGARVSQPFPQVLEQLAVGQRSEERRVGKEGRGWGVSWQ